MANCTKREIILFEEMKSYFSVDFEMGIITRTKKYWVTGYSKIGDIIRSRNGNYIQFKFMGMRVFAHRFIYYCYHGILFEMIDHKNTIRDDNRILNLRGATHTQNLQNQIKPHSNNKTGYLGVRYHKKREKYIAQIKFKNKGIHIGYFSTPEEAHQAYLTAKRKLHEFCTI